MTARMRRLASDFEQVKKDFAGHKHIIVTPIGDDIPEKYHVTYMVNGIYLLPDGRIETLNRHEIEITLHAEYPRYKPICKIFTPIWHPNFRDGQICIGDIWGAGESLSDIIINIGDMIQYKSWNSFSPLCADAAKWAMENKHLFPVGNVELNVADYASSREVVEIDLFGDDGEVIPEQTEQVEQAEGVSDITAEATPVAVEPEDDGNDFEITAEELAGIEFIPTAQRMQTVAPGGFVKGNKVNFKTILVKGLLWALIGSFLGFGASELTDSNLISNASAAKISGHTQLVDYFEYKQASEEAWEKFYDLYEDWCADNGKDPEAGDSFSAYAQSGEVSDEALDLYEEYDTNNSLAYEALADGYWDDYMSGYQYMSEAEYEAAMDRMWDAINADIASVVRVSTGMWAALIALCIGLFLGIGEGIYYGSAEKAALYAAIGAGVSIVLGFISGYAAQWMYAELLGEDPALWQQALIRGAGWAIMGLGVGVAVGLIRPEVKRIAFCGIGGLVGAFIGGFLFDYIMEVVPDDMIARGLAIVIMGILIGIGVGLLEQFAKAAWLKVVRGEFEGKEYLVFAGTTSIGNNGKNTIVLFKDKLVGPHHCDIKLEGSKYVLIDCGTPMGTVVNGQRIVRHILRQGDAIAVGNSVLVFNTK